MIMLHRAKLSLSFLASVDIEQIKKLRRRIAKH